MAKPSPIPNETVAEKLAAAEANHVRLWREHDRVTKDIRALEKSGVAAGRQVVTIQSKADALRRGEQYVPEAPLPPQIDALRDEQAAYAKAIDDCGKDIGRLRDVRAQEIFDGHYTKIVEIEKARLTTALHLQHLNRRREVLRDSLRSAGAGGIYLPLDSSEARLLGIGYSDDEVAWCINRLLTDGIMTKSEIEAAKNGR